ncbi:unnamed protein product [Microthlaspi erraticum]|uniref:TIR domain-containing protein n=1 Tax=Microthlaspi erraticum TaxID=1685480 RepID=A0A6D2HT34_9BRAS|nr:unnamed protein product [Microthlaspi erraticum]
MEPSEYHASGNWFYREILGQIRSQPHFLSAHDDTNWLWPVPPLSIPNPARLLKLRFRNSPPPMIFTASEIEAENGSPIEIELVDAATNTRVESDSSSFLLLEIVVLDADISEDSWTTEEFNRNIVQSRDRKRPLLVGDLTVPLVFGSGVIGDDVAFTDNSSWLRSGKFRLGARAIHGGVVEAISKAFACKDHPGLGKSSRKHYSPYPDYEAWKLDNTAKNSVTESRFTGRDPRPPPLSVHKHSHKINKPPKYGQVRVVKYVSNEPKIIHATVSDFMNVVQRLTGFHSSATYDVVIRYGKGDVSSDDFISHLRAALCRRGVSVNGDPDDDDVDAVPECRVLIIILTSTYVPCNLVTILERQREDPSLVVYPLFYKISPSDLINNKKKYESSFIQDEWQVALKEIAQMPGYILTDKSESELIDEIVRDALKVLRTKDNEKMIGMDMQVEEILSLLCIESPDIRSIGIWGTVGIGKTAIAGEIVARISVQYETCVFVKDLHKEVELKGHDAVREDILCKLLEVEPHVIGISDMKTSFLRSRLQCKRVLVVLDDVNDLQDVETFLEKLSYVGPGSRIILTSRNRRVFVHCKVDHVYDVKPLDVSKSLLLLGGDTFQSVTSSEVFRTWTLEMVKFSNGNPQVLQFCSKSNPAWDQSFEHVYKAFRIYKEWKQLSQRIEKTSPIYIPVIFERSCYGLDDNERGIFLDIACFFGRMDKDNVAMLLDGCGFSAHVGLRSLVDKSLLTISHNMVDMLSFLRATGREIVRQESPDRPGDRSRLWTTDEIMEIFIDNTGTSAIEGIFLNMSKLKFDANPNVFEKLCNLRLLKFYFSEVIENHRVSLPQGLEYLPSKLRLLHWECYPLSSLPRSFDPKNLVELNLPNSCAKKLWKGKKSLEKLRKMRLSYSDQLTQIPRLSNAPNLEHIDLEGCSSLASISQSISSLKKLVFLNLKNCSKLESVPSTVDLESLEVLNLSGCSKLENFQEISPNVKELYLGGTMIQEIPSSIKNLVFLEKLDLENSIHLVNLPTSICKLKHLETLNLSGCTSLERFPDLSRKMKCLRFLDLSRTAIREIPSSISYLTALEELRFVNCMNLVRLPENVWSLRFKVEFRQIDTEKFSRLWNRFGWLKKVQISQFSTSTPVE